MSEYKVRLKVTESGVVLRAYYGNEINTTIKMSHDKAIAVIRKIEDEVVIVDNAISRTPMMKGKCIKTSAGIVYDHDTETFFIGCFDQNNIVPVEFKVKMTIDDFKVTMINLINDIIVAKSSNKIINIA